MATILITGGTGSFGTALTKYLLQNNTPHNIRVLDRSEAKLSAFQRANRHPAVSVVLADIREPERLSQAFRDVDFVFHAAALKTVPYGEIFSHEYVKTNILGTKNVIDACLDNEVRKMVFVSSDKGCQPYNLYGKSKAVAESLVTEANINSPSTKFCSVRGGNIWGSRGSVVDLWTKQDAVEVTDPDITRFHLEMKTWIEFNLSVLRFSRGGEVFIPQCPAWNLGDLAAAFNKPIVNIGPRDGDKKHELLVSDDEAHRVKDQGWAYILEPGDLVKGVWDYRPHQGSPVPGVISSDRARRMSIDEIQEVIRRGNW